MDGRTGVEFGCADLDPEALPRSIIAGLGLNVTFRLVFFWPSAELPAGRGSRGELSAEFAVEAIESLRWMEKVHGCIWKHRRISRPAEAAMGELMKI